MAYRVIGIDDAFPHFEEFGQGGAMRPVAQSPFAEEGNESVDDHELLGLGPDSRLRFAPFHESLSLRFITAT